MQKYKPVDASRSSIDLWMQLHSTVPICIPPEKLKLHSQMLLTNQQLLHPHVPNQKLFVLFTKIHAYSKGTHSGKENMLSIIRYTSAIVNDSMQNDNTSIKLSSNTITKKKTHTLFQSGSERGRSMVGPAYLWKSV